MKFRRKRRDRDKKAIMMGLNYPNTRFKLLGCVNDVRNGKRYFRKRGYGVKLLIDKNITKSYNLLEALNELGNSPATKTVFHYSGHGSQSRDNDGDETDGWDETVFSNNDVEITDDQIRVELQKFENKTVYLFFDCCHSGTIVDLPYMATSEGFEQINNFTFSSDIICISGCKSSQTSADVTEEGISYGALSKNLYDLLRSGTVKTWRQLWERLLVIMKKEGYSQIPQLSASRPELFDRLLIF